MKLFGAAILAVLFLSVFPIQAVEIGQVPPTLELSGKTGGGWMEPPGPPMKSEERSIR